MRHTIIEAIRARDQPLPSSSYRKNLRECHSVQHFIETYEPHSNPSVYDYTPDHEWAKMDILFGPSVDRTKGLPHYRKTCFVCKKIGKNAWKEHMYPRCAAVANTGRYGSESKANILPVCASCNVPHKRIRFPKATLKGVLLHDRNGVLIPSLYLNLGYMSLSEQQWQMIRFFQNENKNPRDDIPDKNEKDLYAFFVKYWPKKYWDVPDKLARYRQYLKKTFNGYDGSVTLPLERMDKLKSTRIQCGIDLNEMQRTQEREALLDLQNRQSEEKTGGMRDVRSEAKEERERALAALYALNAAVGRMSDVNPRRSFVEQQGRLLCDQIEGGIVDEQRNAFAKAAKVYRQAARFSPNS